MMLLVHLIQTMEVNKTKVLNVLVHLNTLPYNASTELLIPRSHLSQFQF